MNRCTVLVAAVALACLAGAAAASPAAEHAAACVAALRSQESDLGEKLKSGAQVEPELLAVVRSGIAIIGTQYLAGLREAEARQLLKAAEEEFRTFAPADAEARQVQCLHEGMALYEHASPLEQSLITAAAQRRIRRMKAA